MPHTLWYTLHRLPDLSLGSYAALPHSQHDALLAQFSPSLRMLHRLAISYSLELRWWAFFDPARPPGQRLELALGFAGQPNDLASAPIDAMLRATPIAPYFEQPSCMHRGAIQPDATPGAAPRLVGCQVARLERYWALTELGDEAFQRHSGSVAIALLGPTKLRCSLKIKMPSCRTGLLRTWLAHRGSAIAPSSPCAWSRFQRSASAHSKWT